MKHCLLITATFLLYFFHVQTDADIITASSCSQEDVQEAIDSAKDGDIVLVPAGTSVWRSSSENIPSVLISGKSITVRGAGIDSTVITDSTGTKSNQSPFMIQGVEEKPFRITGFGFIQSTLQANIKVLGTCKSWRVDNCKFDASLSGGRGVWTQGCGVVDHCIFMNTTQGVSVLGYGDESWNKPLTLGSSNAVYIENCLFNYVDDLDGALDAYGGARYVFRYNRVINTFLGHHGLDSGGYRSVFSFEVYENIFINDLQSPPWAFSSRGGTGVLFNNTATSKNKHIQINVINYRSAKEYDPWGKCDGSNPIDGNEDSTGYPCKDQVGRSTDLPDGKQTYAPMYEWENTCNDSDINIFVHDDSSKKHIKKDRDFFNDTPMPDYAPYIFPHPLSVPALISPTDNSTGIDQNPTLLWNTLFGVLTYRIQVAKDSMFLTLVIDTSNLSDTLFTVANLDSSTRYFWRVDEVHSDTMSSWSPAWSFTTEGTIGIKKISGNSKCNDHEFKAFINPISGSIHFTVTLNKANNVTLTVYNIQGKRIWTYKRDIVESGRYQIIWNGISCESTPVATGIYIACLSTGNIFRQVTVLLP